MGSILAILDAKAQKRSMTEKLHAKCFIEKLRPEKDNFMMRNSLLIIYFLLRDETTRSRQIRPSSHLPPVEPPNHMPANFNQSTPGTVNFHQSEAASHSSPRNGHKPGKASHQPSLREVALEWFTCTVCPRSLDLFCYITYCIKWVKNSLISVVSYYIKWV